MDGLRVLHLTTSEEVFFRYQISVLEDKGVNCDVCVVPGTDQIDGNVDDKRSPIKYIQYLPKVWKALLREDYDIIHANYGLTSPFAVSQFRLPVILTLWGSDVLGFDGFVTKLFAGRADAVTVRSEEMRELLGHENAHILPSGVDMQRCRPLDKERARERVGWDSNACHVLFPYSPDYARKNHPLARQVIDEASDQLNLNISLQTVTGVAHEDIPWYMNAADCMLLTSDHEGSPNTVKEAMACNVPVVSTDVGDVRKRLEGVTPGGVGKNQKELVELLVKVVREDSRSNGREKVAEVSWNRIGDRIIELYQEVQS